MGRKLPLLASVIMFAGLLSLGFWQVERLAWKQDLISRITARATAAPLKISTGQDLTSLERAAHNYHPGLISGQIRGPAVFWFTQIENSPPSLSPNDRVGYHVLTPMTLVDNSHVLIDMGFIPARLKNEFAMQKLSVTDMPVIIRWPDRRNIFAADDAPENGLVYVRDAPQIGQYFGLELPVVIMESAETVGAFGAAWPRGGQTRQALSNRHLEYAFTWFALAGVLVFISGLWHMRAWRKRNA
ncbi:MAG: SURF1 family protein [PS1 clade bacterium]|nr:SURF1 family protein [PS1 clade bacterium]